MEVLNNDYLSQDFKILRMHYQKRFQKYTEEKTHFQDVKV